MTLLKKKKRAFVGPLVLPPPVIFLEFAPFTRLKSDLNPGEPAGEGVYQCSCLRHIKPHACIRDGAAGDWLHQSPTTRVLLARMKNTTKAEPRRGFVGVLWFQTLEASWAILLHCCQMSQITHTHTHAPYDWIKIQFSWVCLYFFAVYFTGMGMQL